MDQTEDIITIKKSTRRRSAHLITPMDITSAETNTSATAAAAAPAQMPAVAPLAPVLEEAAKPVAAALAKLPSAMPAIQENQEPTVALLSLSKSKRARKGLRLGSSMLRGGAMRVTKPANAEEEGTPSIPEEEPVVAAPPSIPECIPEEPAPVMEVAPAKVRKRTTPPL